MSYRAPVRGTSLAQQTQDILTERIRNGVYPPKSQIPPENELAAEFNVSRATIRSAISALVERGLVMRRHGIGTFVSQRSGLSNPLNEAIDLTELIASNGFEPGIQNVKTQLLLPNSKLVKALNIEADQGVLQGHKIFTADGEPVIYCVNSLPSWIFEAGVLQNVISRPETTEPLYSFLEETCNQRVEFIIANVRADVAQNCDFPDLPLDVFAPVLVIEEVGHNSDEVALWHSVEYFPGNQMTFELVRHRVQRWRVSGDDRNSPKI